MLRLINHFEQSLPESLDKRLSPKLTE